MNNIKVMPESLSNKIAAGEVVEKPVSIVKELVENSIDANSNNITINLIDSGIKSIEVIDNGDGVEKLDIPLMLKRHATSKITNDADLFNIESLGFRGEALASISAVSKVSIITSVDGINTYKYDNSTNSIDACSGNKGTTIKVDDLFYNTPVRFKHLSTPSYELNLISNFIKRISLIYPNIRFTLTNNDKVIFQSDGRGNVINNIAKVYNQNIAKETSLVEISNPDFTINIYLTHPLISRASKKDIVISVNNRIVKNIRLEEAIIEGYKGYLHTNEYPITFIDLEIDPSLVDVNIHPTKQQIKLSFIDQITSSISEAIHNQLVKLNFVPSYSLDVNVEEQIEENNNYFSVNEPQVQATLSFSDAKVEEESNVEWKLPVFRYIGSLYQTYLMFENEEGLFLLDQHAAQERINYEKFLDLFKNKNFSFQQLLIPLEIELNMEELNVLNNSEVNLEQLGIKSSINTNVLTISEVDEFYKVKSINLTSDIRQIINLMVNDKDVSFVDFYEDVAIMMACKSSIKAHHYLEIEAINYLLKTLNECNNPFTCPHGRPIINKISRYEIEKLFKRV